MTTSLRAQCEALAPQLLALADALAADEKLVASGLVFSARQTIRVLCARIDDLTASLADAHAERGSDVG